MFCACKVYIIKQMRKPKPVYYSVIKHSGHLRTLEKCRKHSPAARVFYIFLVFPNAHRVLSQCNTRLRLLYLLSSTQCQVVHNRIEYSMLTIGWWQTNHNHKRFRSDEREYDFKEYVRCGVLARIDLRHSLLSATDEIQWDRNRLNDKA